MVEELHEEVSSKHEEAIVGFALNDNNVPVDPMECEKGDDKQHRQADIRGESLAHFLQSL